MHAGWAAAVVIAFWVGSGRGEREGSSRGAEVEAAKSERDGRGLVRAGSGSGGGREDSRSGRAVGASGRGGGDLEALFAVRGEAGTSAQLEALVAQAVQDPNPIVRRLAFGRLLESMTAGNAGEIRTHLLAMKADESQWSEFNYAWGALAGEEAFAFAQQSEERDMGSVMTGWAAANPQEAMAMLDRVPRDDQGRLPGYLVESLISGLADHDPDTATNYVLGMGEQDVRRASDLLNIVTGEVLRAGGPEEASRWSERLPDGDLKGAAMDRVANSFVEQDPVAAAAWAEQFAGEDYAVRVIEEVGDEWAERDPRQAVAWLETLPAGKGQNEGMRSALDEWAERDAVGAGEYLLGMAPSDQRDNAISGFVRGYARQDPRTAILWAEDISNSQARVEALTRAGQSLFRRDAQAARDWLVQSGLPPEAQERVLNPPQRRR